MSVDPLAVLAWCEAQRFPACPDGFDPTVKVPLSTLEAMAILAAAGVELADVVGAVEDITDEERRALSMLATIRNQQEA